MAIDKEQIRVAIVGAGPAGLVLALALAKRSEVSVTIFDRLPSHLAAETYNPDRSYTIDITGHGIRALKYIGSTARFDRVHAQCTHARTRMRLPVALRCPDAAASHVCIGRTTHSFGACRSSLYSRAFMQCSSVGNCRPTDGQGRAEISAARCSGSIWSERPTQPARSGSTRRSHARRTHETRPHATSDVRHGQDAFRSQRWTSSTGGSSCPKTGSRRRSTST